MKVGDLVTFSGRVGVIVEDRTALCSVGMGKPYLMGAMMVLIGDKVERVVRANLRMANERR